MVKCKTICFELPRGGGRTDARTDADIISFELSPLARCMRISSSIMSHRHLHLLFPARMLGLVRLSMSLPLVEANPRKTNPQQSVHGLDEKMSNVPQLQAEQQGKLIHKKTDAYIAHPKMDIEPSGVPSESFFATPCLKKHNWNYQHYACFRCCAEGCFALPASIWLR